MKKKILAIGSVILLTIITSVLTVATVDTFPIRNHNISFGQTDTLDKLLVWNNNAGSANPAMRMHAGALQFTLDGSNWQDFSAGVPTGSSIGFNGTEAPTGYYLEDGTSYPISGDVALWAKIKGNNGTDGVRITGTTNGTSNITAVSSCTGVTAGKYILSDTNNDSIPAGTTVISCSGGTLTLSVSAVASHVGESLIVASSINVPDMRGRFARGFDNGAAVDPDAASRSTCATGGNQFDTLGSCQADQFAAHSHSSTTHDVCPTGAGGCQTVTTATFSSTSTIGTSSTGGAETRPKNVYKNFIIKR